MIAMIALVAGLWLVALIIIAAAGDTNGAVATALASDEPVLAAELADHRPALPSREQQRLAA